MAQAGTLAVTFCLRTVYRPLRPQSRKETAFPGRVFLPWTAFPAAESRELAEACRRRTAVVGIQIFGPASDLSDRSSVIGRIPIGSLFRNFLPVLRIVFPRLDCDAQAAGQADGAGFRSGIGRWQRPAPLNVGKMGIRKIPWENGI